MTMTGNGTEAPLIAIATTRIMTTTEMIMATVHRAEGVMANDRDVAWRSNANRVGGSNSFHP